MLPRLDEDTRLIPVLDHLCQGFANGLTSVSDYKTEGHGSGDVVSAEMVDELAQKHWPMCMRHLQDTLRRDRHLKHYGRLQYGLFLKVWVVASWDDINVYTHQFLFREWDFR